VFVSAETILTDSYLAELLPPGFAPSHRMVLRGRPAQRAVSGLFGSRVITSPIVRRIDGWRWIPIFGAFGGFLVFLLRRSIPESPRWLESRIGMPKHADRGPQSRLAAGVDSSARQPPLGPRHPPNRPVLNSSATAVRYRATASAGCSRRSSAPNLDVVVFQPLQSIAFSYGFGRSPRWF